MRSPARATCWCSATRAANAVTRASTSLPSRPASRPTLNCSPKTSSWSTPRPARSTLQDLIKLAPLRGGVAGVPMNLADAPNLASIDANERDDDQINLLEYWHVLRDRRWVVAGVAACVFVLALAATLLATPMFRASSTLQIERDTMKIMDVEGLTPTESPMDRDFYQTQYELLRSRSLARRVVQDLALDKAPQYAEAMARSTQPMRRRRRRAVETARCARTRAGRGRCSIALTIEPIRNSRLVRVNFDSPDPALAARVANAWCRRLHRQQPRTPLRRVLVRAQVPRGTPGAAEGPPRGFREVAGRIRHARNRSSPWAKTQPSLSAQNLGELNASLAQAQAARIRARGRVGRRRSAGDGLGLPQVVASPLDPEAARVALAAGRRSTRKSCARTRPDYPDMRRLAGQIAETDRQIAAEVGNIRAAVRSEFDAAREQESLLESRMAGLKNDVLDLQGRSIQLQHPAPRSGNQPPALRRPVAALQGNRRRRQRRRQQHLDDRPRGRPRARAFAAPVAESRRRTAARSVRRRAHRVPAAPPRPHGAGARRAGSGGRPAGAGPRAEVWRTANRRQRHRPTRARPFSESYRSVRTALAIRHRAGAARVSC